MRPQFLSLLAGVLVLFTASSSLAVTQATPFAPARRAAVASLVAAAHKKASTVTARRVNTPIMAFSGGGASGELAVLQNVYSTLSHADHDYKGHRAHAMKEIAAAAKLLGGRLHGDGRAGEKQALSDNQLREAQSMLSRVGGSPVSAVVGGVGKHIRSAIQHLGIALSIK